MVSLHQEWLVYSLCLCVKLVNNRNVRNSNTFKIKDIQKQTWISITSNKTLYTQVSELGPMGDTANLNGDLTTVTWTSVEKIDKEKEESSPVKETEDKKAGLPIYYILSK